MTSAMPNSFDPATAGALDPGLARLIGRRQALLGPAYRLFYERPLEIVRARGVLMYDADGLDYLDAYNNVPCVGHSHPRVTEAIASQAAVLNTHTRYAAAPILDYAERLLATHDPSLGNLAFCCTGSEAVDLAIRIARTCTGATGLIATEHAYHGTTASAAAISPSLGAGTPASRHVRLVAAPDTASGDADEAGRAFAGGVSAAVVDLRRCGLEPAALIVDSILSTDGVIAEPRGFLRAAAEAIRAAGGLYIADEVQAGFGRLGDALWGYRRHGLAPDIAVMGKPMGNGMPIAATAVRAELMAHFGETVRYFNTFGGNSVCIAAASAVLDIIAEEGLVENARLVGADLRAEIEALRPSAPWLGAIRGAGLYVGVDIVEPGTGEPDAIATARIVNGMRERRVLISATGPAANTLKIRPPLPFDRANIDRLVSALAEASDELRA